MKYKGGVAAGLLLVIVAGWYVVSRDGDTRNQMTTRTNSEQLLTVTTSFYPLQFALERIVGDLGIVTNIGEGRDPHNFEPSVQNIRSLQRADLVVLQGADFEPWGDSVVKQLRADNVPVILATANIALHEDRHEHGEDEHEEGRDHDHEEDHEEAVHDEHDDEDEHEHDEHAHGAYDPHTWLDPVLFSEMVGTLTEAIVELDEDNAAAYRANATALQAELAELDAAYTTALAHCHLNEVVTSHDAFGYVADRYNFGVHTIAGLSTQDTPSAKTLANLREEAREGIGAILLEENSITAYGETLARETGLETLSINPIAYAVPSGENYLTLMRQNLETFAIALQCHD